MLQLVLAPGERRAETAGAGGSSSGAILQRVQPPCSTGRMKSTREAHDRECVVWWAAPRSVALLPCVLLPCVPLRREAGGAGAVPRVPRRVRGSVAIYHP